MEIHHLCNDTTINNLLVRNDPLISLEHPAYHGPLDVSGSILLVLYPYAIQDVEQLNTADLRSPSILFMEYMWKRLLRRDKCRESHRFPLYFSLSGSNAPGRERKVDCGMSCGVAFHQN
jgi:hypothetical protein